MEIRCDHASVRLRRIVVGVVVGVVGVLANQPANALLELDGIAAIAVGAQHTCAITTAGGAECWGDNESGQLGDNSTTFRSTPVDVSGLGGGVAAIAAGEIHTCALTTAGSVKCWGYLYTAFPVFSIYSPVVFVQSSPPVGIPGLEGGVAAIAAGGNYTCALTTAGGVKCFDLSTPVDVPDLGSRVVAIALRGGPACALTAAGGIKCFQIGDPRGPVDIPGLGIGVVAIAGGCALTTAGEVKCWEGDYSVPVVVPGLGSGIAAIAVGGGHSCALTTSGGVKCWGDNFYGQLGDGSRVSRPNAAPVLTSTPFNFTDLWWNPAESGWGINFNHQGNVVFATLFSYDTDGLAMWLSGALQLQPDGSYSGDLFRSTGTPYFQLPFVGSTATKVGTMTIRFSSTMRGTLQYTVNGVGVQKSIERQVFASPVPTCTFTTASRTNESNYQDLWWNPSESGWGINFTHQGNIIFATLFIYASTGRDGWLSAPMFRQPDGSYTGTLGANNGPAFNANPWTPVQFTPVGTMTVRFSSGDRAVLNYTVLGTNVTKNIQREVFGSSVPVCR